MNGDNFNDAVIKAINLGNDTDTVRVCVGDWLFFIMVKSVFVRIGRWSW